MIKPTSTYQPLSCIPSNRNMEKSYMDAGNYLIIRHMHSADVIPQVEISHIEAANNYCLIYLQNGQCIIASKCMKSILSRLSDTSFLKIHRKYAVNTSLVRSMDYSKSIMIMNDGSQLSISRSLKKNVRTYFKQIC